MNIAFWRLMQWEWRRARVERTSLVLTGIWIGLLAIATWQGVDMTQARHAEIRNARAADALTWAEKRTRLVEIEAGRAVPGQFGDPRSPTNSVLVSTSDRPVTLVPTPLAALAVGASETSAVVLRSGMLTMVYMPPDNLENPANRLAGRLDLSFLVSVLLPLFVLALAFDVLARDRELGIWPVLASQPTGVSRVVVARLGVHFLLLWFPLLIAAGTAVLLARPPNILTAALGELILWLLLAAAYLIFWQALAAWINFRGRSAAGNALALCGVWLAFAVLIPAFVQFSLRMAMPAPDQFGLLLAQRDVDIATHRQADEVRADFYARHGYQPPATELNEYDTFFVGNIVPRAFATDEQLAPTLQSIRGRRELLAKRTTQLAWLSPTLAFRTATDLLAGVSPPQQDRLVTEAAKFQQAWRTHFGAKLASMTPLTVADYDTKPEPPSVMIALHERMSGAVWAILGLIAAAVVAIFLAGSTYDHD